MDWQNSCFVLSICIVKHERDNINFHFHLIVDFNVNELQTSQVVHLQTSSYLPTKILWFCTSASLGTTDECLQATSVKAWACRKQRPPRLLQYMLFILYHSTVLKTMQA